MQQKSRLVLCSLFLAFAGVRGADMDFAVGYEDGLCARLGITDKIDVYASGWYNAGGVDSAGHNILVTAWLKAGGTYTVKEFETVRLGVFVEAGELYQRMETDQMTVGTSPQRLPYNVWSTFGRIGFRPEFAVTENLSIAYRFGLEGIYHGVTYRLNRARTDTEEEDTDYIESGVFGAGSIVGDKWAGLRLTGALAHNIGIFIRF